MGHDAGVNAGPPGWYGKLSTLGDFASRRLPPVAQQALDRWLSDIVAGSRHQLGEDWLQRYLDSPLQRFVLGPEVIDGSWWFGAMMASCDNVGRYFPLVVLQARPAPPLECLGLDHLELWWQRVGEAALETLADEVDVERFDRALADLPPWPAPRQVPAWLMPWPVHVPAHMPAHLPDAADAADASHGAAVARLPPACTPGDLVQALAASDWMRRLRGHSLWWSWRPQGGESTCRIVAGLPSAAVFAAMLGPAA
ncbi:MAG: type VI secretion system-associated protein TagF [Burkholderiales bacterium]|nr:type VI secretion system-associated protein TagF [Burkholderiales bacterium]